MNSRKPTASVWRPDFGYLAKILRRKTDPVNLLAKLSRKHGELHTLVHVGAHLAQERSAYEAAGFTRIFWVEGSPKVHERLAQIIADHMKTTRPSGGVPVVHSTACALLTDRAGDEVELREFSNDGMSNSIFPVGDASLERWPDVVETGTREHLKTRTLDELVAAEGLAGKVDTLVVDVQGAELLVLKGGQRTLANAGAVIAEVSSESYYQGGVQQAELISFLADAGFKPMSLPRRHGDMLFLAEAYLRGRA